MALPILLLVLAIPLSMLRGWAMMMLWGWFIVPTFHLAPLTLVPAMGISLFVSLITLSSPESEDKRSPTERTGMIIGVNLFVPLILVGAGWLYHLWM